MQSLDIRCEPVRRVAELLARRARHREHALDQLGRGHGARLDHGDLLELAECALEQRNLVAHPIRPAPVIRAIDIPIRQRAQLLTPCIDGQLGIAVGKERDRAVGFDECIEPAQRVDAVHPMERAAHHHEMEAPECRVEIGTNCPGPRACSAAHPHARDRALQVPGRPRAPPRLQGQRPAQAAPARIRDRGRDPPGGDRSTPPPAR